MPDVTPGSTATSSTSTATPNSGTSTGAGSGSGEPTYGWSGQTVDKGIDTGVSESAGAAEGATEGDEDESFGFADDAESDIDSSGDDDGLADAGEKPQRPSDWKKIAEELKSTDPAVAKAAQKALKRAYGENDLYRKVFKSPQEAQKAVQRIETLGGLDAVESEAAEWASVYNGFRSGDPKVLDVWFKDNPDGVGKLMPTALNKYREMDPAGWTHEMSSVFMATAQNTGMLQAFEMLLDIPEVANNPTAKRALEKITQVMNAINGHASKPPVRDEANQSKALSEREQKIKQQENVIYQRQVAQQVEPVMRKAAEMAISKLITGKKLSADARADLIRDVKAEFSQISKKDPDFQKNAKALLESGETERFLRLVKSKLEQQMPFAAKRVWRKYQGISGIAQETQQQRKTEAQSRREAGGGGAASNTVRTASPKPADVDWTRMREVKGGRDAADTAFMNGWYLKKGDGKNEYRWR
jgi:hypothetical protein